MQIAKVENCDSPSPALIAQELWYISMDANLSSMKQFGWKSNNKTKLVPKWTIHTMHWSVSLQISGCFTLTLKSTHSTLHLHTQKKKKKKALRPIIIYKITNIHKIWKHILQDAIASMCTCMHPWATKIKQEHINASVTCMHMNYTSCTQIYFLYVGGMEEVDKIDEEDELSAKFQIMMYLKILICSAISRDHAILPPSFNNHIA